jgi:argininosuccinate lyase
MKQPAQRTWGGRFSSSPADTLKKFTESVSFDWRLCRHDIAGSIAHAKGLARIGLLTQSEAAKIERGLRSIGRDIDAGRFKWDPALEDVHMNIEAALIQRIGKAGEKLHTARSRNDQVATDLRLWLRDEIRRTQALVRDLQRSLVSLAEGNADVVMPGYTHLQRAQPVLMAHHLLAYVEMLGRDDARLDDAFRRTNICPLGSGAIAGSTIKLDRRYVAKLLGFDGVTQNSMDAVSDRDFVVEYLAAAALCGMHLSRLAEDLVLWSSAELGFVTIADAYTTGSSLMPQKKNPDIAELTRGKTGRLYGSLVSVLTVLKGLPLTYNRDLQEDKQPLFDAVDTLQATLVVLAEMMRHTKVNRDRCQKAASDPLLLATDLVDLLVRQGVPFRQAHHAVGSLVGESERTSQPLAAVAAARHGKAAGKVFDLKRAMDARVVEGAPSPRNVRAQVKRWKRLLSR